MGDSLRKFVSRAPRYTLRPQDRNVMRFSLEDSHGTAGVEDTLLVNLSETGVAFVAPFGSHFHLGDRIKVEVPVPQGDQIAWWGRVVRVQEYSTHRRWFKSDDEFTEPARVLIAVTFENLPGAHSRVLKKGIQSAFLQALKEQRHQKWLYYKVLVLHNLGQILLYSTVALLAFAFLYFISRPDANYDAKKGAPWGERFKF